MLTSAFDFELPEELIAQHPVESRDHSRLMVVDRAAGTIAHHVFRDLPELLNSGDVLVRNSSKVIPAGLAGHRTSTGGSWEALFIKELSDGTWQVLATTRGKPVAGETIVIRDLELRLESKNPDGSWQVRPLSDQSTLELLNRYGQVPLPPYIRKGREAPEDRVRYQTVYAEEPGSVAAPTAGLHFTEEVFERLKAKEISWVNATLHVGIGTFRPIKTETIEEHQLHEEWAKLAEDAVETIRKNRESGGRAIAVGTTSVRTLEAASLSGSIEPFEGPTALYLKPGHVFRTVDAMVTNFHLPKSSLLVLVAAFAGYDLIRTAYAEAVARKYRFYSYGDAMLIL